MTCLDRGWRAEAGVSRVWRSPTAAYPFAHNEHNIYYQTLRIPVRKPGLSCLPRASGPMSIAVPSVLGVSPGMRTGRPAGVFGRCARQQSAPRAAGSGARGARTRRPVQSVPRAWLRRKGFGLDGVPAIVAMARRAEAMTATGICALRCVVFGSLGSGLPPFWLEWLCCQWNRGCATGG